MGFKGLFSLKLWVIVGFVIYWNLGMGIVMYFNQDMGTISSTLACFSGGIFLLITSIAIVFFTLNENVKNILVSPEREHLYDATPFGLIGVICFVLSSFLLINGFVLAISKSH